MSIIFSYQTKKEKEKEKKRLFSGRRNRANPYPLINEERQNDENHKNDWRNRNPSGCRWTFQNMRSILPNPITRLLFTKRDREKLSQ
jgi:hypothetical protein